MDREPSVHDTLSGWDKTLILVSVRHSCIRKIANIMKTAFTLSHRLVIAIYRMYTLKI